MQNKMKLDAEIFDADLNENRCKFARQPAAPGQISLLHRGVQLFDLYVAKNLF